MATTLDGITLNINMHWTDRFASDKVVQNVRFTLGEVPVVFAFARERGTPITLVASADQGWLTYTVVQQLIARAAVPGAVYILSHNGINYSVIFRHNDAPAVDMQPLVQRVAHEAGDYFIGSIKLLTV